MAILKNTKNNLSVLNKQFPNRIEKLETFICYIFWSLRLQRQMMKSCVGFTIYCVGFAILPIRNRTCSISPKSSSSQYFQMAKNWYRQKVFQKPEKWVFCSSFRWVSTPTIKTRDSRTTCFYHQPVLVCGSLIKTMKMYIAIWKVSHGTIPSIFSNLSLFANIFNWESQ